MEKHYYIRRSDARDLFLSPFFEKSRVVSWEEEPIVVETAADPQALPEEHILYFLYSLIDRAVDAWIQELKYIPRLLNSAAAFLVLYFFFSFVVRDPIPIVDEILFSGAGAFGVYVWTARRNRKSDIAQKRRTELKRLADAAEVNGNNGALKQMEEALTRLEQEDVLKLCEQIVWEPTGCADVDLGEDGEEIMNYLTTYIRSKRVPARLLKHVLDPPKDEEKKEGLAARLLILTREKKIDLPLIGLFASLVHSDRVKQNS
ncbi:MAG: hypothetical protein ACQEQU_01280 [Spirochaetota bacterium]